MDISSRYKALLFRRTGGDPKAMAKEDARLSAMASRIKIPGAGTPIEFLSDHFTDKGPATGTVVDWKTTVDGNYLTVKFGDSQEMFSWDDLSPHASRGENGTMMIKALPAGHRKHPIVSRQQWNGLELAIENPVGSLRSGKKPDGGEWHTRMKHAYGEITGSCGVDGDPVDIFIGPDENAKFVYIVHQRKVDDWDNYDEDKCLLNFSTESDAKAAFLANYDDPRFLGPITKMPVEDFIKKVKATKEHPAMIKSILIFMLPKSTLV